MRGKVLVWIPVLALVLAACGGAGDGGGGTTASPTPRATTSSAGSSPEPTEAPEEPTEAPAASALVGSWKIGLDDRLDAVLSAYGTPAAGLRCSGTETISFGEDGAFRASMADRCGMGDVMGSVRARFDGTYEDRGDAFVLRDVGGNVTAKVAGIEIPVSGWTDVTDPVAYRVTGDRLEVVFDLPDGVQVRLVYRAA